VGAELFHTKEKRDGQMDKHNLVNSRSFAKEPQTISCLIVFNADIFASLKQQFRKENSCAIMSATQFMKWGTKKQELCPKFLHAFGS
jgi:hypothetical protein